MQTPITAEYIWLDSDNKFRSKIQLLSNRDENGKPWIDGIDINGSYTGQAEENESEIFLTPCTNGGIINSPFNTNEYLVLCYTTDKDGNPIGNAIGNYIGHAI